MNQLFARSTVSSAVLWAASNPGMLRAAVLAVSLLAALVAAALTPGVAAACQPTTQGSGCGG